MRGITRPACWLTAGFALGIVLSSMPLQAQTIAVPVFDASNYTEDLIQVFDLAEQVANMFFQAQPLPVNMFARYNVFSPFWAFNTLRSTLAGSAPLVGALNTGDPTGAAYRQAVDPLDTPTDVLTAMPPALQRRLLDSYAAIELADSAAALGVDQTGTARANGNALLEVLQAMKADAFSPVDTFQTQTALLNKINSASVVGLQVGEETNQFLSSTLEALLVETTRERETEARLMNATIHQWRYGPAYGQALFSRTAADLNSWTLR